MQQILLTETDIFIFRHVDLVELLMQMEVLLGEYLSMPRNAQNNILDSSFVFQEIGFKSNGVQEKSEQQVGKTISWFLFSMMDLRHM